MARLIWLLVAIAFDANALNADASDRAVLQFTLNSCSACKLMQPAIDQLRTDGVSITSIDGVNDPVSAERWNVQSYPTVIVLESGREVDRIVGSLDHAEFKRRVIGGEVVPRIVDIPVANAPLRIDRRNWVRPEVNALVGDNFPRSSSMFGPNHPANHSTNRGSVARQPDPLLGENHPYNLRVRSARSAATETVRRKAPTPRSLFTLPTDFYVAELPETMAATVRIRIADGQGESVGTGTVVEQVGEEVFVLTCGHIFQDMNKRSRITVERIRDGKVDSIEASLVEYRNDELDLGFVKYRSAASVTRAPILDRGETVRERDFVFSIGCDAGAAPSRRNSVVTRLNRFIGPPNIETGGAPTQGRSGGGLFDSRGRLIGVCVAADYEADEGLYVGFEAIHAWLDKLALKIGE